MSTNIEHMTWTPEISDYEFYYWSVPFRGKFVRAVLAYVGKTWTEGGDDTIERLMRPDQNLSSCNAYIHVAGDRQPIISHEPPRRPLTAETWCLGIGSVSDRAIEVGRVKRY